jgi:hypothetical protein
VAVSWSCPATPAGCCLSLSRSLWRSGADADSFNAGLSVWSFFGRLERGHVRIVCSLLLVQSRDNVLLQFRLPLLFWGVVDLLMMGGLLVLPSS